MNRVFLKRCDAYDVGKITPCLEAAIEAFGGLDKLFEKGKKVVIKPNLVMKKTPDSAAVTHPAVVEALINILKRKTDDITIAECPGGPYTKERMNAVFRAAGYTDLAQRTGAKLCIDLQQQTVSLPNGKQTKSLTVMQEFCSADLLINVAKLKSHGLTVMTGAAKNLYGLIPGLEKAQIHARFPDRDDFAGFICDLNTAFKPALSIIDAVMCMEGNGPTGGNPRFVGMIIASDNAYAADMAGARLMNLSCAEIPLICQAAKRGLCPESEELLEYVGDDPEPNIVRDFKKPDSHASVNLLSNGLYHKLARSRPKINKKICVGCGECVQCCPQKTITIKNRKAHINGKNCILCYCCQELCPKKAVDLKRFFVFNILK